MGRGRKRHFRHKKKSDFNNSDNQSGRPLRKPYKDIIKENENFEKYYKVQEIVPAEEWDEFMKSLREVLPATFRITGYRGQAKALLNIIKGKYFQDLMKIKDDSLYSYKPFSLQWYPGDLAWQMKLSRVTIRSSESLRQLHNFLVSETETGNISRQETVSMIPPLLLNIEPHHKVFDMCAAPGSKTAQLIEFLHRDEGIIPGGLIVANDLDNKRCYMLVHQAKRLNSPCLIITNNDAANYPNIKVTVNDKKTHLKFDRILCDVPCSGDGTIRKTAEIWNKWNAANGNNLHGLQLRILRRGLELLAPEGRIVYSTCSLNPVENEAVIATMLSEAKGSAELLDVRSSLQGLKTCPGLSTWKVANKELEVFERFEEVPEKNLTHIRPHMFPPDPEVVKEMQLNRCIRILPHHQDTGGFFVAVIQKKDKLPWERSIDEIEECLNRSPILKKRKVRGYKEDPFVFLDDTEDMLPTIKDFYNLENFPTTQLLSRCKEGKKRNLYFTSDIVKNIVEQNIDNIKIINTGIRVLCRSENKDATCTFRLTQEGISTMLPFMRARIIDVCKEDIITLLSHEYPAHTLFTKDMQEKLSLIESGCIILRFTGNKGADDEFRIDLCSWKGNQTIRCYVPKVGRAHYLRICGVDVTDYEMRDKKKFKLKDGEPEKNDSDKDIENENEELPQNEDDTETETLDRDQESENKKQNVEHMDIGEDNVNDKNCLKDTS
ncbi:RNA cytosine-C(5)-methyltransferase NSUN2-like [Uloborus diversus]|uniref:RNA cytosine-C(5)-methyltransferase NSUN2-like n=1 Tax=Uloborus diversus TaxID=327109 RepID=UPI002409D42A|nr:RNA cytosine-C(5)-methyltransferase NSUN2-like [Uloborus diversus]